MIKNYVPFLKLKQGEVMALSNLAPNETLLVTPLMELPRDDKYTSLNLKTKIDKLSKKLNKYCSASELSFFIDNYEVSDAIKIDGNNSYQYLLNSFQDFNIYPVCGLDRSPEHNALSIAFAKKHSKLIGLRITRDYFQSISAYTKDLKTLIDDIGTAQNIVILLDNRLIIDSGLGQLIKDIKEVIKVCSSINQVASYVIAGSSLPSSASMYMGTNQEIMLNRLEVQLFAEIKASVFDKTIVFGDYTTVSPDYSEISIDPRMMQNVITARITYSTMSHHYVIRGGSVKQFGNEQYFDLSSTLVGKAFYRGEDYSFGDNFLKRKSERSGSNVTASTIITPQVNAHLAFMISQFS